MLGIFHTWLYMPCPKLLGGFGSVAFCFLTFVPTVITDHPHDFLLSLGLPHIGSKLQDGRH